MKKVNLIFVTILLYFAGYAEVVKVKSSSGQTLELEVSVQKDITFQKTKYRDGKIYTDLWIHSQPIQNPGKPYLPAFTRWILIPNGTIPKVSTTYGKPIIYENIDIAPAQTPLENSKDAAIPSFVKDEKLYMTNANFPGMLAETGSMKHKRGQALALLRIYPYQFNPVKRTLTIYPDMKVTITFEGEIKAIPSNLTNVGLINSLKSMAINAEEVLFAESKAEPIHPKGKSLEDGCEFLIITAPDYEPAANTLAQWKTKRGIKTSVVNTSSIGESRNQIKLFIKNTTTQWTQVPSYILLFGDVEDIPVYYHMHTTSDGNDNFVGTDFCYMDNDFPYDHIADYAYGRLSVDNVYQAFDAVYRIIDYEKNPPSQESYYKEPLLIAMFQDGDSVRNANDDLFEKRLDSVADRRFAKTSEDVLNFLETQGFSAQRVYRTENRGPAGEIFPTYWNNNKQRYRSYSFENDVINGGSLLPDYLQKENFPWNGNKDSISNAINGGKNFVLYNGHGSRKGWGLGFVSSQLDSLSNVGKYPVIWSMSCNTGWFDHETDADDWNTSTECFAEQWIRNSNSGAVGVLASSRTSYGGYNDRFVWGMMNAIWPNFFAWAEVDEHIPNQNQSYRIGDVINYGKAYVSSVYSDDQHANQHVEEFHWFGDPTMEMWTVEPLEINSADLLNPYEVGDELVNVLVEPAVEGMLVAITNENGLFGTGLTNAEGIASVQLNREIIISDILFITVTKHNFKPFEKLESRVAIWEGNISVNWHDSNNWQEGIVPDIGTSVIIPAGTPRRPYLYAESGECFNLVINESAALSIWDENLVVKNDMIIDGQFRMHITGAKLEVMNDMFWEANSVAVIDVNTALIDIEGNLNIRDGSTFNLQKGEVRFTGTKNSLIKINAVGTKFRNLRSSKTNGAFVEYNSHSTEPLIITYFFYNTVNSTFRSTCKKNIILKGHLSSSNGAKMLLDEGGLVLDGNNQILTLYNSYFNKLIISPVNSVKLNSDITIRSDLKIESGVLLTDGHNIEIGGDWDNQVGLDGFVESDGRVIFNGSKNQLCESEEFNIVEVNKSDGWLLIEANDVHCEQYDWTQGGVKVSSGSFTVDDLIDNGIFGSFFISGDGTINLTNNDDWVDLCADVKFTKDGVLNIYGGTADSFWAFSNDISIIMEVGGLIDFHDVGVYLHDGYTIETLILAGTIRTAGNFLGPNSGFKPSGGIVECVSDGNHFLGLSNGSFFRELIINKDGNSSMELFGNNIVKGDLKVKNGDLILKDDQLTCKGNMYIDGKMSMSDNSLLRVNANKSLIVKQGGMFESIGSENSMAKVTRSGDGYYNFLVNSFGTIASEYTIFEYMGNNGVEVKNFGIVTEEHSFDNCIFRRGKPGDNTSLLTINNSQNLEIEDATFTSSGFDVDYNVSKNTKLGGIQMISANGNFAGEAHEFDPFKSVDWINGFKGNDGNETVEQDAFFVVETPISSNENNITIYPNPTNGLLNIQFNESSDREVRIINMMGKIILQKSICGQNESIDLSAFENGIYFIRIETATEVFSSKIIKE